MRVVFMGTPDFAVPIMCALAGEHDLLAVYTRPDAPRGRGRALMPSPVKEAAEAAGLPVMQPPGLRDDAAVEGLRDLSPDVVVVAAFGLILPPAFLAVPRDGCVNVHASLLPRHRGAAPVQRAILEGDEMTGVSIMLMEAGLDTGPVALRRELAIDDSTAAEVTADLAGLGSDALLEVLGRIEAGTVEWERQDDSAATYAAKVTAADVALSPLLSVDEAVRRVRASGRSAPARAVIAGTRATITRASVADGPPPGAVSCAAGRLLLGCAQGALGVESLVPEGRREMDAAAWCRGARLDEAPAWSAS